MEMKYLELDQETYIVEKLKGRVPVIRVNPPSGEVREQNYGEWFEARSRSNAFRKNLFGRFVKST